MNNEELAEIVKDGASVIKLSADWCTPCKVLEDIITDVKKDYDSVAFVTLDIEESPEIAKEQRVVGLPTLLFFKDGEMVESVSGLVTADQLRAKINNISGE